MQVLDGFAQKERYRAPPFLGRAVVPHVPDFFVFDKIVFLGGVRVVVMAMSGGVDSSVSAHILIQSVRPVACAGHSLPPSMYVPN